MAQFQYKAKDDNGNLFGGEVAARDVRSALRKLVKQGLTVISIELIEAPVSEMRGADADAEIHDQVEQEVLKRQGELIQRHAERLVPALTAYAKELRRGRQRRHILWLVKRLEAESQPTAANASVRHQWLPLLCLGATSGDPGKVLSTIIEDAKRTESLKQRFDMMFAYPLVLMTILALITAFCAWLITPVFNEIFADFGTELPLATRFALRSSALVRGTWGAVLILPPVLLAAAFVYFRIGPRWAPVTRLMQAMPFLGPATSAASRGRFTRCLADLIQAEVPVVDALRISGRSSRLPELRSEAHKLAKWVEQDIELLSPPENDFPKTMLHAIRLKSNSATISRLLREVAWLYERQTDNRLRLASQMMEPIFLVLAGLLTGGYFLAMMLPLTSLIQNLT